MKLDFSGCFKNLDGTDMVQDGEFIMLKKVLGNVLGNAINGDPVKLYDWALKLYKTGELDIDRSDWATLKKFVIDTEKLANILKAQLLERFILTPE